MTSFRISDAAQRTGLSTSTLRYYERIGLLQPPKRTDSGYRAYDERALDRLAFVARARALGLRLDAIGELADLWDADRCGPVQARLRDVVSAKIADTQEQAAALLALSSELASYIEGLASPTPDAPCGERCGCHAEAPTRSLAVLADAGPGIACSLVAGDAAERVLEWQALATRAIGREATDGGIRLTFDPGVNLRVVADLVAREQGCCSFLSFAIGVTPSALTLEVDGPTDARPLIEALMEDAPSRA